VRYSASRPKYTKMIGQNQADSQYLQSSCDRYCREHTVDSASRFPERVVIGENESYN